MRRALRRALRPLLALCLIAAGDACFEIDLTGLDPGSGTGCYLCYPLTYSPDIPHEPAPVAVAGGLRFAVLSVGAGHVCGVTTDAAVHCWGERHPGSPASGSTPSPELIAETSGFDRVAAGLSFTCGMRPDDRAMCWGRNVGGETGTGESDVPIPTPSPVEGGLTFTSISTSSAASDRPPHACGLTASGTAYCWGNNALGALGNGTMRSSAVPVAVAGGHVFESISVGADFTCGIVRGAGAHCWGLAANGRLGADSPRGNCNDSGDGGVIACSTTPTPVANGGAYGMITAGGMHACATDGAGVAYCWGSNSMGQLGAETHFSSLIPARVSGSLRFAVISAGSSSTCGLTTAGEAFCWGSNALGEVGDGTLLSRHAPSKVATDLQFASVDAGQNHACALTADGAAYCWGSNLQGKVGKGS
jgi:alpha-tubulin suppressor-like RCC1 family protein